MITLEQQRKRRHYVGSSDIGAILGVDPYRTAGDVYLEKTGKAAPFEGNEATNRGNLLESAVLDWAEQQLGTPLTRSEMIISDCGLLAVNLDALSRPNSFIVEGKTTANLDPDEWGDAGTDLIPERFVAQTHLAMYVTGPAFKTAWVPVLLPGYRSFDFRMYRVDRDDELAEKIASVARDFLTNHVRAEIPPEDFRPSLEVLKRVRREPGKTIEISDELVASLVAAKAAKKKADDDCETAQAAVIAALDDAEAGTFSGGIVTYKSQTQKRVDADRLRLQYPDAARECEKEITFRVMRLPTAAKGRKS